LLGSSVIIAILRPNGGGVNAQGRPGRGLLGRRPSLSRAVRAGSRSNAFSRRFCARLSDASAASLHVSEADVILAESVKTLGISAAPAQKQVRALPGS